MLDAIGCAFAARKEPFAARFAGNDATSQAKDIARSSAPQRLPLRDAALTNGMLCHGLDYDDTT